MPEQINNHSEQTTSVIVESEKLQEMFERRLADAREQLEKLFNTALEQKKSLIDIFLSQGELDHAERIFGKERICQFIGDIKKVEISDKSHFVEQMMAILTPFHYDRYFNQDIRRKADAIERVHESESHQVGNLNATINLSEWDLSFSDHSEVKVGDKILEISWPSEGDKPSGFDDIEESFREVAKILKEQPAIKAVIGVSWMMSRGITTKLGFEKFPEIKLESTRRRSILDMANTARHDKEYKKGVKEEDVIVGAMSRELFLEKYGE